MSRVTTPSSASSTGSIPGGKGRPAPTTLDPVLLDQIAGTARDLAAEAGDLLLRRFRTALDVEYKDKGHEHPVTIADREAEQFLRTAIKDRYPAHGVLGEEGSEPPPDAAFVWVVDPLDGTTNYINGLPMWCVSVGVLWHGRPIAGAIFTPCGPAAAPATLSARFGGGAFCNGNPLHVAQEAEPTRKRLATLPAHYWKDMRFRTRGPNQLGEARTLGSIALELALVATGALQYGIFWSPKIWDVAGGVVIVREAGGAVLGRTARGKPWLDLHHFEPAVGKGQLHSNLRAWRGSLLAGADPAVRTIADDIRARAPVPAPVKQVAARLLHPKRPRS